jgi:predicted metalloprotease with PDZ domain
MLAGMLLGVVMLLAPATFAADCLKEDAIQGPSDEWKVQRGSYLGVEVTDVTKDRVAALKLKDESGVEVTAVDGEAPAAKAGIKDHDVILSINGQKIESEEQLRRIIRETPAGRTINLVVSRDGQPMNLSATLASRKVPTWVVKVPKVKVPPVPPMPAESFKWSGEMPDVPEIMVMSRTSRIGAMVETITPQLADFFGVKDGTGLLVRSVEKGSVAETAGLKAGDVIVRVDKERINDLGDWRHMLHNKSGNVSVGIIRDKRELNVTINLPQRQSGALYEDELGVTQLAELKAELAKLPQINEEARKAYEEARKEFEAHRGEYEKEMQKAQKELQKSLKEQQKSFEKMQKEMDKSFHTISFED